MRDAFYFYEGQKEPGYQGATVGYRVVADMWGLPHETFRRRLTGPLRGIFGHVAGGKGVPRILKHEEENELARHIAKYAQAGFPFRPIETRDLAYEYAKANNIPGFSQVKSTASKKWFYGFIKRHKEQLTMKKPQLLSVYRAKSLNKECVDNFFELYKSTLERHGITSGMNVWNFDETGAIDCPRAVNIVGVTHEKAQQLTPNEKGQTTTVVCYVNAMGLATKPMVIHKGTRVQQKWKEGKPLGFTVEASKNGWIDKRLTLKYGEKFVNFLNARGLLRNNQKHLVIMDGHKSHTFNYPYLKLLKDNNIECLALPAHTTQCLQPLDNIPYAKFKTAWYEELRLHARKNCARKVTKSEWFDVFCPAWSKSITVRNIRKGFEFTGIWPVDRSQITDDKLGPSRQLVRE